jgi:EAL domain-containing protein (putative c-di-GMP-specific phosphodiesterase class I)
VDLQQTVVNVIRTVQPSVVEISSRGNGGGAVGSGEIITNDGYVLTNHHVVDGALEIKVELTDNRTFTAKLIGSDQPSDVAVLKIDAPKDSLHPILIGTSHDLKVGQKAYAKAAPEAKETVAVLNSSLQNKDYAAAFEAVQALFNAPVASKEQRLVAVRSMLTITTLLQNAEDAIAKLEAIRGLGLGVAIDDFGTGYSSLSYLQRFPATAIKIARDFVAVDEADTDSWELASAIVSMGRALRLTVIAEGVEEPFQLERLRKLRCSRAQGYYLARPLPADELEQLFSQPRTSIIGSRGSGLQLLDPPSRGTPAA